jgi:mono/diheme cytochrome c family protein
VLYAENCAVCHGENLQGRVGATLAKDWPSIRPDLGIRRTIAAGIQGTVMPAWSQASGGPLDEAEIDDLVAFILSTEGSPPHTPAAGTATVPAAPSWFTGWGGVLLAVVGFILIVGIALVAQTRR